MAHVRHNSGNNEWYTPPWIIESARQVMGSIDLDPASCEEANKIVQAKQFYTDGLNNPWYGWVWLNPPYARGLVDKFMDKTISELDNIEQIMILVNNATETKWFQKILPYMDSICLLNKRVRFWPNKSSPLQGQVIMYRGQGNFREEFTNHGHILTCSA